MEVELIDVGLDTTADSGGFSADTVEIAGGAGGEGSTCCTAEAIFLNFLCRYVPSDSSHLCSTGSTAGVVLTGDGDRLCCGFEDMLVVVAV